MKVSADGRGVVSHAGIGLLRELADLTGLSAQFTAVLADTYMEPWVCALVAVSPIWPRRSPMGRIASLESPSSLTPWLWERYLNCCEGELVANVWWLLSYAHCITWPSGRGGVGKCRL